MMVLIAISYRRNDGVAAATAGRIYNQLRRYFDKSEVFLDVETIDGGGVFGNELARTFSEAKIVLLVIGEYWIIDNAGINLFSRPDDWVRKEIEYALRNPECRIVPILVKEPTLPEDKLQLPDSVRRIFDLHMVDISHKHFKRDIEEVFTIVKTHLNLQGDLSDVITWKITLGIVRTHNNRPSDQFNALARQAQIIHILQTWIPNPASLRDTLSAAIRANAQDVKVLMLDPESPHLVHRAELLGFPIEAAKMSIEVCRQVLHHYSQDFTNTAVIQVRLYDSHPYMQIYRCDNVAFVTPLFAGIHAHETPTLEIHGGDQECPPYFKRVIDEFEWRWNSATKVLDLQSGNFNEL